MTLDNARGIAKAVNAGHADAREVLAEALVRAEASQTALNAFTVIEHDWAKAEAEALHARIAAGERLPLAGVPLIVKDNIWVGGRRISQGSKLFADHVAPVDALCVARARAAGAVVIGIGACSEFAAKGVTTTPLNGVTHHPMDQELTPGGSSGGNAAAVAAGVAPLALGTDGGGSSRRPPAHCGIVGLKTSQGVIPHPFGFPEPFWGITAISPMARSVADAALLFEAVAGPDLHDPESRVVTPLADLPREAPRLAISRDLGLGAPIDDDVAMAFDTAAAALRKAGLAFASAAPDWPAAEVRARLPALQFAGLAAIHGDAAREQPAIVDPDLMAQIERGFAVSGTEVAAALEASLLVRRASGAFFHRYDLLVSLTTPCVAWPHRELGPPLIGGVPVDPRGHASFTPLFNHGYNPAISIPCGRGRNGLPVGLQLIGAVGTDRLVLHWAERFEAILAEAGLWSAP